MEKTIKATIFRDSKDINEKRDRFNFVQNNKHKYLYPLINWMARKMEKYIVKDISDIPDEPQNRLLRLVWEAELESREEYFEHFIFPVNKYEYSKIDKKKPEDIDHEALKLDRTKHAWYNLPLTIIKIGLTVAMDDSAARERIVMYLRKLHEKLNKLFDPEKEYKVPVYTSIYDGDPRYFAQIAMDEVREHNERRQREAKEKGEDDDGKTDERTD